MKESIPVTTLVQYAKLHHASICNKFQDTAAQICLKHTFIENRVFLWYKPDIKDIPLVTHCKCRESVGPSGL